MSVPQRRRMDPLGPRLLTAEQRRVYEEITDGARADQAFPVTDRDGHLLGPFDPLLRVPGVGDAVQRLGERLRFAGILGDRTRELVILTVASHRRSDYEWYAHSRVARELLAQAELDALRACTVPATCDEAEGAALALVGALLRTGEVPQPTYLRARELLGEEALVELACLVGYYSLLAGVLATFGIGAPDEP